FTASFGAITLSKSTPGADLFVAKLTTNGTWQWATQGGGDGDDFGQDLAFDAAGNLMLAGSFRGSAASFGTLPTLNAVGIYDIIVAQLSADGRWNWVLRGGGDALDYSSAIAMAPNGDARIVGTFYDGTTRFGSTTLLGVPSGELKFDSRGFVTNVTNGAPRSQDFTLWPNPSRGTVWATGMAPNQLVQVFDAVGRLVASNVQGASQANGLALPPLRPGLYFVRAGNQTRRLELE
ncbi:MAG TPA: T9SS type A sorting domain-containing protein, partial [Hymenobacter sp.]